MVGMFGIVGIYMVGTKVENLDIKDCTAVLFTAGKQTWFKWKCLLNVGQHVGIVTKKKVLNSEWKIFMTKKAIISSQSISISNIFVTRINVDTFYI